MNINNLFLNHPVNSKNYMARIPVKSGKFYLSIVCGTGLYSTPRESLKSIEDYTEFEVAVFNMETDNWASYNEVKPIIELFGEGEYQQNYDHTDDNSQCAVFGYIPKDKIIQALNIL